MSLYAIGDLHLSLAADKPMEVFGKEWKNHVAKIEKNWIRFIHPEDTVVVTGDHSWGRNLEECGADLDFIEALPSFLQNNYYSYEDWALVGTKGYCYEGKDSPEHFEKLVGRELDRLRISFETGAAGGYRKFIMFLHYPPTSIGEMESGFTRMAEEYGASQVIYSHCHGKDRYQDSFLGEVNGIESRLALTKSLDFQGVFCCADMCTICALLFYVLLLPFFRASFMIFRFSCSVLGL